MFARIREQKIYKPRRENPSERDFIQLYRFTTENVEWIAQHFLGESEERRGGALNPLTKMKTFLRYVSDPGFQTGVAEDIGISQPTVSNTVKFVTQQIVNKADTWIRFPQDAESLEAEKLRWSEKYRFPTAIGVIDCTLIKIKKIHRNQHGHEYICRKQFSAINVQAKCNADELFTSVSAEWPGSVRDSRIWRNSDVCHVLRNTRNSVLLGDQGYGIEPCLMTPYQNPTTQEEIGFNNLFKKERVLIERCFGQLKQRFPLLQNTVRVDLSLIPSLIVACFVLHNIARYLKDDNVLDEDSDNILEDEYGNGDLDETPERAALRLDGQRRRNELAAVIYQTL